MAQRNDQVFQLSLTEIAFTVAFILLLLLGYLVVKEQSDRKAAEAELTKLQSSERVTVALEAAKGALTAALQGTAAGSPDEVITKLIAAEEARAERDRLRRRVDDLDAQLSAMEELRRRVEEAAQAGRADVTRDEVSAALALQDQVRKALADAARPSPGAPVVANAAPAKASSGAGTYFVTAVAASDPQRVSEGTSKAADDSAALAHTHDPETGAAVRQAIAVAGELKKQLKNQLNVDLGLAPDTDAVREVVTAARNYHEFAGAGVNPQQVRKENSDLRGQVAFLKNRLDARGGRDYPPCWADESGKVEFLFAVEVKPDLVVVKPSWPVRREAAARELPGMAEVLEGPISNQEFVRRIQGISKWSRSQDPECRHYVQLKSSISDAVQSDRARLMVESFFYKTETRR